MRTGRCIAITRRSACAATLLCAAALGVARAEGHAIQAPYRDLPAAFFTAPDPAAPAWADAAPVTIVLLPQTITTPSLPVATVQQVAARALHNGRWLAVRLEWSDPTQDASVDADRASDACAIQFPLHAAETTSPFMGSKEAPVAILHWKAIWQRDLDEGYQTVTTLHPHAYHDFYPQRAEGIGAAYVKNPVAQPRRAAPVEELIAAGYGTLTTQAIQNARGRGVWANGRWAVVFARSLVTGDRNDPPLTPGARTALGFAVWDGGQGNVGARKNYAPWVPLVLEQREPRP